MPPWANLLFCKGRECNWGIHLQPKPGLRKGKETANRLSYGNLVASGVCNQREDKGRVWAEKANSPVTRSPPSVRVPDGQHDPPLSVSVPDTLTLSFNLIPIAVSSHGPGRRCLEGRLKGKNGPGSGRKHLTPSLSTLQCLLFVSLGKTTDF